jgi:uncharacterized membrane protein YuzA (DUF378 family)
MTTITTAIIILIPTTHIRTLRSISVILPIIRTGLIGIIHTGIITTLTGINTHTGIIIPTSGIIEAIKIPGKDAIIHRGGAAAPLNSGLHHGRGVTATGRFDPDPLLPGKDEGNPTRSATRQPRRLVGNGGCLLSVTT